MINLKLDEYKSPSESEYDYRSVTQPMPMTNFETKLKNEVSKTSFLCHAVFNNGLWVNGLICYVQKIKNHEPIWIEWSTRKPLGPHYLNCPVSMCNDLILKWKFIRDKDELERLNKLIEDDAYVKGITDGFYKFR